jgi:two-component system response regulator DevR
MENTHSRRSGVFIVEDSVGVRQRLVELLSATDGVAVVGEAASAAAAVEGILHTQPQFVVLDLHLPGGSGLEVLREVHPQVPEIVFLVFTNYPEPQYRRICMQAGASYFLDKNSDFARVREIVARPASVTTHAG